MRSTIIRWTFLTAAWIAGFVAAGFFSPGGSEANGGCASTSRPMPNSAPARSPDWLASR